MMVSPEWYEENLKGKPAAWIRSQIRRLEKEICHLEKVVANPREYMEEWGICPDPQVQLELHRQYLQVAIQALQDS